MTTFLVTNDDGVNSPMLPMLVAQLQPLGTVRVVVPAHEQSWKGKAMTRFGSITARPHPILESEGFVVDGTPADCVNLGVHNLFDSRPDWVISGINIGINAGLAFLLNSGTVGAAMEAALLGIPAVAYSQHVRYKAYEEWSSQGKVTSRQALDEMQGAADWCGRLQKTITRNGLPKGADLISVNFPFQPTQKTRVSWAGLLINTYGQLFQPDRQGGFEHRFQGEMHQENGGLHDWEVVHRGEISVTPLSLQGFSPTMNTPYVLE